MTNIFDEIQKTAFGIVANTFGYSATWNPSNGGQAQSAIVLYKDATEKEGLSDVDINTPRYEMEYKINDFPGLIDAVANVENDLETVTINITGTDFIYYVRSTKTKYDGKTVVAVLDLKPTV